jgi:hypothetical protein
MHAYAAVVVNCQTLDGAFVPWMPTFGNDSRMIGAERVIGTGRDRGNNALALPPSALNRHGTSRGFLFSTIVKGLSSSRTVRRRSDTRPPTRSPGNAGIRCATFMTSGAAGSVTTMWRLSTGTSRVQNSRGEGR